MKILIIISFLSLIACNQTPKERVLFDFENETAETYMHYRRSKDSSEIYHRERVKYLSKIDLSSLLPVSRNSKENTLLLVTSEFCAACDLMPEILDSLDTNYPSIEFLVTTSRELKYKKTLDEHRFIGVNKLLCDTLLAWSTPTLLFLENNRVVDYLTGGPIEQSKFNYLYEVAERIDSIFNLPNNFDLSKFEPIPWIGYIYLENDAQLKYQISEFNPADHLLDTCNQETDYPWLCKIDQLPIYGIDYMLQPPKYKIDSLVFLHRKERVPLETSSMYLPSPIVSGDLIRLTSTHSEHILSGGFSDGAGFYFAKWKIDNRSSKRILISNEEEDFDY